jgi:hypothetical protein
LSLRTSSLEVATMAIAIRLATLHWELPALAVRGNSPNRAVPSHLLRSEGGGGGGGPVPAPNPSRVRRPTPWPCATSDLVSRNCWSPELRKLGGVQLIDRSWWARVRGFGPVALPSRSAVDFAEDKRERTWRRSCKA